MRRRQFLGLVGITAAGWPISTLAQKRPTPTVGFLSSGAIEAYADLILMYRVGLGEAGFAEGRNVTIEWRGADGRFETTEQLAAELVARGAIVLVATGNGSATAARAASPQVPLVFISQGDPVKFGLVASLGRPGGLATGLSLLAVDLLSKRLEVLRQLTSSSTAVLINPKRAEANAHRTELHEIARLLGREVVVLGASTVAEIEEAFTSLPSLGIGALLVSTDAFFFTQREHLTRLAASSGVPTAYDRRELITAGGLLSYGADYRYAFRQLGVYTGKVLKGARPADLPVEQSSRVELVINLKAANALGLTIPPTLLARADEVIE